MDVTNKISMSPRSLQKIPSFGVADPSESSHYPPLSGDGAVLFTRKLTRLSSSFKDIVSASDSIGQEASDKPLQDTIQGTSNDPEDLRIRAIRPNSVAAPAQTSASRTPMLQVEIAIESSSSAARRGSCSVRSCTTSMQTAQSLRTHIYVCLQRLYVHSEEVYQVPRKLRSLRSFNSTQPQKPIQGSLHLNPFAVLAEESEDTCTAASMSR